MVSGTFWDKDTFNYLNMIELLKETYKEYCAACVNACHVQSDAHGHLYVMHAYIDHA